METVYNPLNPVAFFELSAFEKYFNLEEEFMPAKGYADSKEAILRQKAMLVILENSKCENFDAFIPYLAMSYFDRFISRNPLPNVVRSVADETALVANCCLMLAWKMRHSKFNVLEFLAKTNMIKHQRHIMTVEFAILNGLNWKMRAVTAICFINMFVRRIQAANYIKRRIINQIIIQLQGDITFTKYKPSLIAAAAILVACKIEYEIFSDMCYAFFLESNYFGLDELDACCDEIYKVCIEKRLLMEEDREGHVVETAAVGEKSQAQETSSSSSHRPGKEPVQETSEIEEITSEIQEIEVDKEFRRRPGKEPVSEVKDETKVFRKSENETDQMNFELKWALWSRDAVELTIDSPLFRTEAVVARTTSAENDDPSRAEDTNHSVGCSPVTLPWRGCTFM